MGVVSKCGGVEWEHVLCIKCSCHDVVCKGCTMSTCCDKSHIWMGLVHLLKSLGS
jgi:hypothetical protein